MATSPYDLLQLAKGSLEVATNTDNPAWFREVVMRTAASRAYYACFHKAQPIAYKTGFADPRGSSIHVTVWKHFGRTGEVEIGNMGLELLKERKNADYDLKAKFDRGADVVDAAEELFEALEELENRLLAPQPTLPVVGIDSDPFDPKGRTGPTG